MMCAAFNVKGRVLFEAIKVAVFVMMSFSVFICERQSGINVIVSFYFLMVSRETFLKYRQIGELWTLGEFWTVENFHFEQHFLPPEEQSGGEHGT